MKKRTRSQIGKRNQANGKNFEKMCVEIAEETTELLTIKHIDRTQLRSESLPDIEILDFPQLKLDCKAYSGYFSYNDLEKLLKVVFKKYCGDGGIPIIIFGPRYNKSRITRSNIGVAWFGEGGVVFTCRYVDWLRLLESKLGDS